ncbi:hypothetical protein DICVIV_10014 [Dictyocaulus viviparus]|uniref:G-protein coupled receptors family 1 profile domain-containing protein n=1 Tax=Dictyocaulus viviparus TaxID=29172 RepID=A0A0D8XH85_DICVI|nr:hypothetical protein DICVIV_10014 [Dictyocaulus viviparus]
MLRSFTLPYAPSNSETHVIRHDICVYWQLVPIFGCFFSSLLLLNVALDRLLSLRKIYITIDKNYRKLYMTSQTLPSVLYASIMVIWIYAEGEDNKMVVCVITAPMNGSIYIVFVKSILLFNILILACYISFMFLVKKVHMSKLFTKYLSYCASSSWMILN